MWTSTDADKQTLLTGDYAPHAADIASAIRQVMTAVKPDAQPRVTATAGPRRSMRALQAGPAPDFSDMEQAVPPPRSDGAHVLRTLAGIHRRPPLNPDAFRAALNGNVGFVLACDGSPTGFSYTLLPTLEAAALARGTPTVTASHPMLVGGIFGDIWDGITSVANDIYEGVKKVVVTIADQIEVAITKMVEGIEQIVHVVVDSVQKAVDAVVGFFKELALAVYLVILFLRALFDWDGIRGAQRLIKRMLNSVATILADDTFLAPIKNGIGTAFEKLEEFLGLDTSTLSGSTMGAAQRASGQRDNPALAHANGVQAKMTFHKLQDHGDAASLSQLRADQDDATEGAAELGIVGDFVDGLTDVAGKVADLNFNDAKDSLLALIKTLAKALLDGAQSWLTSAIDSLAQSLQGVYALLDTEMNIPYLAALYGWIFDEKLTILNLICLVIAVPVHVVYYVVTLGSRFCDDGQHWLEPGSAHLALGTAAAGPAGTPKPTAGTRWGVGDDSKEIEIVYVVMQSIHVLVVLGTDLTFSRFGEGNLRGILKFLRGIVGILASIWAFVYTLTFFNTTSCRRIIPKATRRSS